MKDTSRDDSHLFPHHRQPAIRIMAMSSDTNHYGHIFGGWIMSQMDVAGSIVAVEYARNRVATVAVTSMEFHKPVHVGDLISCFARIEKIGNTSITVQVEVFAQRFQGGETLCVKVTQAIIVYVAVSKDGTPRPLPRRDADRIFSNYL